jgi:uncharacterized OB-fold protein
VSDETTLRPVVAEGLLGEVDGRPRLMGSRCAACGNVTFPQAPSCPRCTAQDMAVHLLAPEGTLWSWTIQGFPPKSPPYTGTAENFVPYGVGYVELAGEVRVEARLTVADPERLAIGMAMTLVLEAAPDGRTTTYAFAPADDHGGTA